VGDTIIPKLGECLINRVRIGGQRPDINSSTSTRRTLFQIN
jgi:hypothetical protein